MPVKYHDTSIWDKDWFINLPKEYKLFYLYIKDQANQVGIYHPNKTRFQRLVNENKIVYLDDFLRFINKNGDGSPINRVIVLPNKNWFITGEFVAQLGDFFRPKIGAHRGALKQLLVNDIHPSEIPDFDWRGIEQLNLQQLREIVQNKHIFRMSIHNILVKYGLLPPDDIEEETPSAAEPSTDPPAPVSFPPFDAASFGSDEQPVFSMQGLYDKSYEDLKKVHGATDKLSKEGFELWKEFVDFVVGNGFTELFRCRFLTPKDFEAIYHQHNFTREWWEPTCRRLLSTGIQPHHNLHWRLPEFLCQYVRPEKKKSESVLNAGKSNFKEQYKW